MYLIKTRYISPAATYLSSPYPCYDLFNDLQYISCRHTLSKHFFNQYLFSRHTHTIITITTRIYHTYITPSVPYVYITPHHHTITPSSPSLYIYPIIPYTIPLLPLPSPPPTLTSSLTTQALQLCPYHNSPPRLPPTSLPSPLPSTPHTTTIPSSAARARKDLPSQEQ